MTAKLLKKKKMTRYHLFCVPDSLQIYLNPQLSYGEKSLILKTRKQGGRLLMNLVRILAYYLSAVTMSKLFYPKIWFLHM